MIYQEKNAFFIKESTLIKYGWNLKSLRKMVTILTLLFSIFTINSIYVLRLDRIVGQFSDDAFYIVLAKSIAEQGIYQIISSPIQGIQPSYPPGFPLLLAIVLRIIPLDADHLWVLKALSIFAMNFLAMGMFIYCRRVKQYSIEISWMGAIMVSLSPALTFLATSSVMSECVFTCLQIWTVIRLETAIKNRVFKISTILTLLFFIVATFYTRSIGVALIIAIFGQLLRLRLWRVTVILILGIGGTAGIWTAYSKYMYPNVALRHNHGGNIVETYFEQLTQRNAGIRAAGNATTTEYIFRVTGNIKSILGRDMVGIFIPAILRTEKRSGEEVLGLGGGTEDGAGIPFAAGATFISLFLSIIIFIGFIVQARSNLTCVEFLVPLTIGLIIIWPWLTFRFILPLMPFLICYLIDGLSFLIFNLNKYLKRNYETNLLARIGVSCFLFFFIFEHVKYIHLVRTTPLEIAAVNAASYLDETCVWMRDNLPAGSVIASTDPAKVFLATNHLAVTGSLSEQTWEYWKQSGIRYVSVLRPQRRGALEAKFKIIFATTTTPSFHVIDLGEPDKRESWAEFKKWCETAAQRQAAIN